MQKASVQEYADRVRNVRKRMAEQGLDALIVHADMRDIGGGNAFYLSGHRPRIHGFTEVIVPIEGELALVVQPGLGDLAMARRDSWIKDVRGEHYGFWSVNWPAHARDILTDRKLAEGKIGLSGTEVMSPQLYQAFHETLPKAKLVDAAGLVEAVRAIKSPWEMEVIREANRLSDVALNVFMGAAKPGKRQTEAIGETEYRVKQEGADDCVLPMGAGKPYAWGMYRADVRFTDDDVVGAEFNARIWGYWGQVCRTRFLGTPTREQQRRLDVVRETHAAMLAALKPGVTAQELFEAGLKPMKAGGYDYDGIRWGHGMGLTYAEGFNIVPGDRTVIEAGSYVMLHPHFFPPPDADPVTIDGDSYLVLATGNEKLTHAKEW